VFVVEYLPGASHEIKEVATFSEYVIIAAFAGELVMKLAVARRKLAFLRSHWLDVLIVVVPFLRPLRFLRFLRFLPLLLRGTRGFRRVMGAYQGAYVVLIALIAVFVSSVLMTVFEEAADGSIRGFSDALWWAIATVTTVGYGDVSPVTTAGRAVAVFLMIVGIALFGLLTAGVAAYFVEEEVAGKVDNQELLKKLDTMEGRLEELKQSLDELNQRSKP